MKKSKPFPTCLGCIAEGRGRRPHPDAYPKRPWSAVQRPGACQADSNSLTSSIVRLEKSLHSDKASQLKTSGGFTMRSKKSPQEVTQFFRDFLASSPETNFSEFCASRDVNSQTAYGWRRRQRISDGFDALTKEEQQQVETRMASKNTHAAAQGSRERLTLQPPGAATAPRLPGPSEILRGVPPGAAPAATAPRLPGPSEMLMGVPPGAAPAATAPRPGYGQPSSSQAYLPQPAGQQSYGQPHNPAGPYAQVPGHGQPGSSQAYQPSQSYRGQDQPTNQQQEKGRGKR